MNIKRIAAVFLCVFTIAQSAFTCSAAGQLSFRIENNEVKQGSIVETRMLAKSEEKLGAALFEISYDQSILEYRDISVPKGARAVVNSSADNLLKISYLCADGADIYNEAAIFTLSFKTRSAGCCELGLSASDCVNAQVENIGGCNCTAGLVCVDEKTENQSSVASKKTSSKTKKSKTVKETVSETKADYTVNDFKNINKVVQKDFDRLTPIIILSITAVVVIAVAGVIIFKAKKAKRNDR